MNSEKEKRFLKKLGNRLKELRKAKGHTQLEFAEKNKISYRHYQDIESGKINIRLLTLLDICQGLKIKIHDLLNL